MKAVSPLVRKTILLVEKMCEDFTNPAVLFSGGKDSMVMLDIIVHQMNLRLPVVFYREPFALHKYDFGMKVLASWSLTAFDYPPAGVSLWHGKGIIAYTNHYQCGRLPNGGIATIDVPKNIVESVEPGFLCGLDAFLRRPVGTFECPWDLFFSGHKSCDEDQIAGKVPLHVDLHRNQGAASMAFPLREWTTEQVWQYTEDNNLLVDHARYEDRQERPDKHYNSDYFEACIRCIDRRADKVVVCPKTGLEINNISEHVPYRESKVDYC